MIESIGKTKAIAVVGVGDNWNKYAITADITAHELGHLLVLQT